MEKWPVAPQELAPILVNKSLLHLFVYAMDHVCLVLRSSRSVAGSNLGYKKSKSL